MRRSRSHESGDVGGGLGSTAHELGQGRERSVVHGSVSRETAPGGNDLDGATTTTSSWSRRPARDSSYSSSIFGDGWMSINPTTEVEDSLRTGELVSPARDYSRSSASASSTGSGPGGEEMAMDREGSGQVQARQGSGDRDNMDLTLPENDGMEALREKMHEIRTLAISTEEKAKRMHQLMTQDYLSHKAVTTSPMSMQSGNSKDMEGEPEAFDVGLAAMPIDPSNPYALRPGDDEPSWSPLPPNPRDEEMEGSMQLDMPNLGCRHYKRNVKVQCFDCHRWFPCRHCHDSAQDLPFPHNLRRKMTKNMLCMLCRTPQPAAEECASCGEYAAYYFCPKCKLWDNDSNKRIYHCDDCGICRVGEGLGKDFVHCKRCNVCISISTSAAHPCVEGATERDCPLCLDDLFESQKQAVSMPCGHYMHGECYQELMRVTYKCPVCSKSAVNMELQWRKLDDEIRAQPMPDDEEELSNLLPHMDVAETSTPVDTANDAARNPGRPRTVYVGCNDCGRRSWTPFHWLGVKCQHCDSYNANQMAPPAGHETEAERLIRQQTVHRRHDFTGEGVLRDAGIQQQPPDGRADSALDVPSSPAQLAVPLSPGSPSSSASGLPSPRRYFVDSDASSSPPNSTDPWRRPSFTARGFSTPSLPHLPDLPRLPRMPNLPTMAMPPIPDWAPRYNLPPMPGLPSMPHLDIPSWSGASGVMDSLSRSLSPMRYYLQGLDIPDVRGRVEAGLREREERERSLVSVRSDPTGEATVEKREGMAGVGVGAGGSEDEDAEGDQLGFWGARARGLFGAEEGPLRTSAEGAVDDDFSDDAGSESGSGSGSSSEDEDAEMRDRMFDDDDEDDEEDELDLVGHR